MSNLHHPDPQVRVQAIHNLMENRPSDTIRLLLAALNDPKGIVRQAAIEALIQINDPANVPELINLLERGDVLVHKAAGRILIGMGSTAVLGLVAALDYTSKRIQVDIIRFLGKIGDVAAVPGLIDALDNPDVQYHVIKVLGEFRDERALPALLKLLPDADDETKENIIDALGEIGYIQVVPTLLALLPHAKGRSKYPIIKTLGKLRDPRAIPLLMKMATEDTIYDWGEVDALGNIGEPAVPMLIELVENNNQSLALAARALGNIRDPRAIPVLIKHLGARDDYVAEAIIHALAAIGESAVMPLIAALEDQNVNVRFNAIKALTFIRDVRAVPALILCLADKATTESSNPFPVCVAAAYALEKIGTPEAIAALREHNQ